jgi:hypothetical protein
MCVCVCVCVCARARTRACVHACVGGYMCARVINNFEKFQNVSGSNINKYFYKQSAS